MNVRHLITRTGCPRVWCFLPVRRTGLRQGTPAIAVSKRNPRAEIIGIDHWGKEYASFSKTLCERSAGAEDVTRITFCKGGTFALHDIFSKARYGDMQAFVRDFRDMGYQLAEQIDTADGRFMKKSEAAWMELSVSALLTGRK